MKNELWYKSLGFFNNPFSIKPAAFHNEVVGYDIEEVVSGIESGSAIYVKGSMGVGKTTMLKIILDRFGGKGKVIYSSCNVSDRKISFRKLLTGTSFFNRLLSKPAKSMILLVDEAQELRKQESTEIARLMKKGNFKSVVFFGTEYPEDKLVPALQARLKDNIKTLSKLKNEHAVELVRKRIGDLSFISDAAIKRIYRMSGFNPRKMLENTEDVFRYAIDSGAKHITDGHIKAVVKEERVKKEKPAEPKIVIEQIEHSDVPLHIEPLKEIKPQKPKKKFDDYGIRTYEEEMETIKQVKEEI